MTLFSIQCATCQAKLNVRDPALIGQILACPKCSSMVLVEAPEGFELPAASETDADSGVGDEGAGDDDVGAQHVGDEADSNPNSQISPSTGTHPSSRHDSRADTKPMAMPDSDQFGEAPSRPLPPGTDWSSDESRQMRRLLVLSGVGVGAVVVAVALVGFWMSRGGGSTGPGPIAQNDDGPGDDPDGGPENGTDNDQTAEDGESSVDAGDDSTADSATGNQGGEATPTETGDGANNTEPESGNPASDGSSATTDSAASDDSDNNRANDNSTPGDGSTTDGNATTVAENGGANATDANTNQAPPGFETGNADKDDDDARAAAESLRRLEKLLNPGLEEEKPPARITIDRRPPVDLADKPQPRNVDVPVQLRRPVLSLQVTDVPLIKFLRFVSEMSTIPISLDPFALEARGLRATAPVSVDLSETTVEAILQAAVEPLGLALSPREGHLRITLPENSLPEVFDVADLAEDNPEQLQRLSTWTTSLIAPGTWQGAGGEGTLTVEGQSLRIGQLPRIRFQIARMLDQLRKARQLPLKHDLPDADLTFDPAVGGDVLDREVAANFRIPHYFTDVLSQVGETADVDLLVDWESAASAGWNPDGKVRLFVENQPLSEALDALLRPMELGFHVLDNETIVITDDDVPPPRPLYFHACGPLMETLGGDEQALSQLLTARLGADRFQPQGGPIAAYYDADSKHLLVSAPLNEHRRIAKLLADAMKP